MQDKEPYGNLDMVTCRLSCNPQCTKYGVVNNQDGPDQ